MTEYIFLGVLIFLFLVVVIFSSSSYKRLLKVYKKYDNEFVYCNLTGLEFTARAIDVLKLDTKISFTDKELGDFYAPQKDIVVLSQHTAKTSSVASICISAHELGHAVQNQKQSGLFVLQSCLAILGKLCSIFLPFGIIIGVILLFFPEHANTGTVLLLCSFGAWLITYLLRLATIPMEMQASKIAYNFLKENNVLNDEELRHGKKVLNAAIGTYVASLFIGISRIFRTIGYMFRR